MHKHTETKQSGQQNTNYANTNSYGYMSAPDTEDTKAFRDWRPQVDQGLGYQYESAKNQLMSSFNNPTGGYVTPQMRDAQERTGLRNLNQDEAQAYRGAYQDVNAQRGTQLGTIAALTHPQMVQTGSTGNASGTSSGTGSSVQSGGLLGDILVSAAGGTGTALA
jgi:hypothetical protein